MEVSSQKVIFDADGGNAVITVATNADGWDYAAEGDWFTVARQDGNALLVETLINAGAETLTGKLTVSAEKNGETVSQEVALVQRAERSVNLSAEGTANCYIARTGGVYKFDASVKGNGGGDNNRGENNGREPRENNGREPRENNGGGREGGNRSRNNRNRRRPGGERREGGSDNGSGSNGGSNE